MRGMLAAGAIFTAIVFFYTTWTCIFKYDLPAEYLEWTWLHDEGSPSISSNGPSVINTGGILLDPAPETPVSSEICTSPHVRKEWRALTDSQKESWIGAVKCLANLQSSGKISPIVKVAEKGVIPPHNKSGSWYDDFSYVHMDLNNYIHQTGLFLPWHRYFLWSFEQSLRKQCNYREVMPYWDWTKDASDFRNATIFGSDPKTGLGSFGHPAQTNVVLDGSFAQFSLTYPTSHALRREFTPYPFLNLTTRLYPIQTLAASDAMKQEEVDKMVRGFQGDFKGFQSYIEGMQGAHMSVHLIIGGDLGGTCLQSASETCSADAKWSPNEPLFWLHHGMVDKVWSDWQRAHASNFWAFEGGTVRDLDTWPRYTNGAPPAMNIHYDLPTGGLLVGNYTLKHMFNTTANTPLCYVYDDKHG